MGDFVVLPDEGSIWIWQGNEKITVIQCMLDYNDEWWVHTEGEEANRVWHELSTFKQHVTKI